MVEKSKNCWALGSVYIISFWVLTFIEYIAVPDWLVCFNFSSGRSMNSNVRHGSSVSHYKPSTMSDMPSPSGSWAALNSARQSKYNMHLIIGVAFTVASLAAVSILLIAFLLMTSINWAAITMLHLFFIRLKYMSFSLSLKWSWHKCVKYYCLFSCWWNSSTDFRLGFMELAGILVVITY